MSIATEISRLQTAKADIKAALESKTIAVSSTLKIDEYVQLINKYLVKDTRVVAKYNVTSTSSPTPIAYSTTGFSAIEIDGVELPSVVSAYTFSTKGTHTVKYTLTDPTTIGVSAFTNCTTITSVSIPNTVATIDANAFYNCNGIVSVNIPSGVTSIGDNVFGSDNISSITVDSGNTVYDSRNNCNAVIRKSDNQLVVGCKNTVIPNTVTSIGNYAFYYCRNLTSITIPNTVTSIGNLAFRDCRVMTTCTMGNGITSIGRSSFYQCFALTSLTIPSGVTSIGNGAFAICYSLTSIVIPSGVTSIGRSAFRGCSGLTSITSLRTTAPTIQSNTFRDVKTGGTLTVPSGSSGYDVWMGTGDYYLGKYGWTKVEQ